MTKLFWWIVLPLRQTNALYKCGFFEGILKKAKFVVMLIFPDSLFHGNYWDLKFSWIPTKTTHGSTYDSPLPVFAEKKLCIIVLLFCNIIALKLLVKDRSAGPVLRDISMTSLQNVRPGYARKNWLVHPSNSLIRSKIEEYMKCQIATKLFYFHPSTIHSNTN